LNGDRAAKAADSTPRRSQPDSTTASCARVARFIAAQDARRGDPGPTSTRKPGISGPDISSSIQLPLVPTKDILGTSVREFFLILTVFLILTSRLYALSDNFGSTVNVTAILEDTSWTIPSNFPGLSLETQDIIADTIYTGSNTSLQNLVKLLGSNGILRVGGTSQDTGHQGNPTPALTQRIVNDFAGFNSRLGSGWSPIYGLDLGSNNPSEAVTQAGYIINAFGIRNVIFQIGNEPDNWYSPSMYMSMWNDYYSSLSGSYSSIIFAAPDVAELISNAQNYTV
jgi:hypothetical protein